MQWIRAHRYTVALIGAAIFIVVGGILLKNNSPAVTEQGGIENVAVEYPYYTPPPSAETSGTAINAPAGPQNAGNATSSPLPSAFPFFATTPPPKENPSAVAPTVPPVAEKSPEPSPPVAQSISQNDPYALFFQALSKYFSPVETRTPEQQALFAYGNAVGLLIKTFETTHTEVIPAMKAFFDSRIDASKTAEMPEAAKTYAQLTAGIASTGSPTPATRLQTVADAYVQLSAAIKTVTTVPSDAQTLNAQLADGYANVATGLSLIAEAGDNAAVLEAIKAYDTNTDEFVKNYVALVQLFAARGVKFASSDPGSVFSFSMTGGL